MNDFAQWESELERPAFVPPMVAALRLGEQWQALNPAPEAPPASPYRRTVDTWRVQYHQGRYWHVNVKRSSGASYPGMNYTMRGAFVCAPLEAWAPRGAVPFAWYGTRLATIQTFRYDGAS